VIDGTLIPHAAAISIESAIGAGRGREARILAARCVLAAEPDQVVTVSVQNVAAG